CHPVPDLERTHWGRRSLGNSVDGSSGARVPRVLHKTLGPRKRAAHVLGNKTGSHRFLWRPTPAAGLGANGHRSAAASTIGSIFFLTRREDPEFHRRRL